MYIRFSDMRGSFYMAGRIFREDIFFEIQYGNNIKTKEIRK